MQRAGRSSFAYLKARQWTPDPGNNSTSVSKLPTGAFWWSVVPGEIQSTLCALSPCVCKDFRAQLCIHLSLKREQLVYSPISSENHSWIHRANVSVAPVSWKGSVSPKVESFCPVSQGCAEVPLQTGVAVTCFMSARYSTTMLESARQRSLLRGVVPWELAACLWFYTLSQPGCLNVKFHTSGWDVDVVLFSGEFQVYKTMNGLHSTHPYEWFFICDRCDIDNILHSISPPSIILWQVKSLI